MTSGPLRRPPSPPSPGGVGEQGPPAVFRALLGHLPVLGNCNTDPMTFWPSRGQTLSPPDPSVSLWTVVVGWTGGHRYAVFIVINIYGMLL